MALTLTESPPFPRLQTAVACLPQGNLAPADLPSTLGVLAGGRQLVSERMARYAVVGELALDGAMRPAKSALSMAIAASQADGLRGLPVPNENARETAAYRMLDRKLWS